VPGLPVAYGVRGAAGVPGEHRQAGGGGLQEDDPEPFDLQTRQPAPARHREDVRGGVERREVVVRMPAREHHPVPREAAQPVLVRSRSDDQQCRVRQRGARAAARRPELIHRLRDEPDLVIYTVEELLRYEPPVQFISSRVALEDIDIAGTTIPKGAPIALALAAGSRDPEHVPDPGRFIPDRRYNEHLGFGAGIHYCFGTPLARLEAQIALSELAKRLPSSPIRRRTGPARPARTPPPPRRHRRRRRLIR
jgi:hypothetical protein